MTDMDLKLEFRYQERGNIATKRVEETSYLFIDDVDWFSERQTEFEKTIRKAVACMNKEKLWGKELTLYEETDGYYNSTRIALLCRETGDEENDVYTLYLYGQNTTDKQKVSRQKAIQTLIKLSRESTQKLMNKIKNIA